MNSTISPTISEPCKFVDWHFDPSDGQLKSQKHTLRLQPRIAKLLALFLANTHQVITREQLVDILWQDKAINEDALSRCIAELRSALGDNRSAPLFIETVPKKGYRFIQSVSTTKTTLARLVIISSLLLILTLVSMSVFKQLPSNVDLAGSLRTSLISAKRVTTDIDLERQPQLSNKGETVAFSVVEDQKLIVKVIDLNGNVLHKIIDPEHNLYSPTFSNSDRQLLIAGLNKSECNIYIYNLPTLTREKLGSCYIPNLSGIFDWSPNDKNIAYIASDDDRKVVIWLYDLTTKIHTQLTSIEVANVFDSAVQFSPDGQSIAFTRGTNSSRDLFTIKLAQPEIVIQLTDEKNSIAGINWLNDNQHIIFDSDELGERNLWLLNLKTKRKQLLGAKDAQYPSMNLDGSLITFQEVRYNAIIWSVDLSTKNSQPKKLIDSIKYNNHPVFSPNGKSVSFTSNREGKSGIWIYSLDTKEQTKLISIPNLNVFFSSWSKDGDRLLVSTSSKDGYHCYHVNVLTKQYQKLFNSNQQLFTCQYSNDDMIFGISKITDKPTQLLKLEADGSQTLLLEKSISRIQVSGINTIIYTLENENGIYSIDIFGNNNKVIINDFNHQMEGNWAVSGQFIYYPKLGEHRGVWQYNMNTNEEKLITTELPSAIGMTMGVSQDQSTLLLTKTESRKADIYISTVKK